MGICVGKDDPEETKAELTDDEKTALSNSTKERRANQRLIENMVHEEFNRDIEDVYLTKKTEVLGSGLCGIVRVCVHKQTKIQYALKTLDKKKIKDEINMKNLKNEIRIMALLGHPNIVRLHEYFETPEKIYLVMELCGGGELLEHLNKQPQHKYPEKIACKLVRSILGAIRYCHEHNIVHRDLKLENFLFENKYADAELKLIDFGLSQHFQPSEVLSTPVGTPYYVAPEVLLGAYDSKCDIWSIGVITYMLLSGSPPFCGSTDAETLRAVQEGELKFNQYFNPVSEDAKDFIKTCLTRDPTERPNAETMQKHIWFRLLDMEQEPMSTEVFERLKDFEKKKALTRLCIEVVAHTLTSQQIKNLRKEFLKFDVNQCGEISYEDLHHVLVKNDHFKDMAIDSIFRDARTGWEHTGKINYHEFIAATISITAIKEENIKLAFEMMSKRNGYITAADIQDLLGKDATTDEVERMLLEVNLTVSSKITYKEFERIMMDNGRNSLRALSREKLPLPLKIAKYGRHSNADEANKLPPVPETEGSPEKSANVEGVETVASTSADTEPLQPPPPPPSFPSSSPPSVTPFRSSIP